MPSRKNKRKILKDEKRSKEEDLALVEGNASDTILEFYDCYHLDKPKDMKREKAKAEREQTEKIF